MTQPNEPSLIDLTKIIILALMAVVTSSSLLLSHRLSRVLAPLLQDLRRLHQEDQPKIVLKDRLERIKQRYVSLFNHVDDVDTAEFSAGEIESISFRFLNKDLTAAGAHSWLRQAPGLLISLGLLGTFAGLTVGLGQISSALVKNKPDETINALKDILAPMGAAFETSLVGLFLSLLVLTSSQLTGSRDGLERCEALLSSWLETVLPQQLGNKLVTPLRQSIEKLNTSLIDLPNAVYTAVDMGMRKAFADKLETVFNIHANLATEAQTAIRQLGTIANALNESGEDFLQAAQAFRHSDFATLLQQSSDHLQASGEQLSVSTERLSLRLADVRDNLTSTQAEWRLLAQTAAQELQTSRSINEQVNRLIPQLQDASSSLHGGTQTMASASKQLRQTRLEVMKDRQLAQQIAESLQGRLIADSSLTNSCQTFASALETALTNWNRNVERLDLLSTTTIEAIRNAMREDEQSLVMRAEAAGAALDTLRNQLQDDLGSAVEIQREAIAALVGPAHSALELSHCLLARLKDLQTRLNLMAEGTPRNPADGGNGESTPIDGPGVL